MFYQGYNNTPHGTVKALRTGTPRKTHRRLEVKVRANVMKFNGFRNARMVSGHCAGTIY